MYEWNSIISSFVEDGILKHPNYVFIKTLYQKLFLSSSVGQFDILGCMVGLNKCEF